ncbi:phosphopantetheine-binding protein [Streptomyces sp. NPDC020742]|uniref:phosphopantetheine-binding protein n=1 Tax=unclassified Streptomyces TaxID=2593676 RepID=UPI0033F0FAC9
MAADPPPARIRTLLDEITDMLVQVAGEEILIACEITAETTLNDDLALESIEFVALAELLQQRYGTAVDFLGLLAERDLDQILALTVGELAGYIDRVTATDRACAG